MHAVGSWLDLWLEDSGHGAQDGPEQVKRGGKAEMLTVLWQRETEVKNERSYPKPPKVVGPPAQCFHRGWILPLS